LGVTRDSSSDQVFGLSEAEVTERRSRAGLNKLPDEKKRTKLEIYVAQFKNPLIYVICVAAAISLVMGEIDNAIIIGIVILLDSVIGFFQEYKSEEALGALKSLVREKATVYRDGIRLEIDATELVPGDVVVLNEGSRIPADGKVLESVFLTINEAILTGESEPIPKKQGDETFMGTTTYSGRGMIEVTSIGLKTELGKIAGSIATMTEEQTPLQFRLEKFSKSLTYLVVAITIGIFVVGVVSGIGVMEMVKTSIVLAIAAIPEGLLIAVTMILVLGMRSILRRQGLVKKLLAVETLGSVTTICTDKTGTLTEGVMKVVRFEFKSNEKAAQVLTLCNNQADSLEAALWNHVKSLGYNPEEMSKVCLRVYEVPFSSDKKYMLTVNEIDGVETVLIKGAPEIIMDFCSLTNEERAGIEREVSTWANSGLKPLAVIYRDGGSPKDLSGFEWIGLVGIQDPVRPTVKNAILLCRSAGIKVKVITGDYRGTAEKVANLIGLSTDPGQVIEGKELNTLSENELAERIKDITIFCRVVPSQKLRIVNALQARGEIVAMIGDGVNDAPALKKSNIGVSVGNATDVAKETASLILLDSNFGTLVNAVEEGRIIFENIKKVVAYVLSDSFAEILTIFSGILLGWPSPLTIAQLLWIHLICDGPSDIALGFEKGEKGIMEEKPKSIKEGFLSNQSKILIFVLSASSAVMSLILFNYYWNVQGNINLARTVVFTTIAVQDLVYIFSYRSLRLPIFSLLDYSSNKWLFVTVAFGFAQQLFAIYVPFMNDIMGTVPLQLFDWAMVLLVAFILQAIIEVTKYFTRHHNNSQMISGLEGVGARESLG
jgi:Ca2+-transporting ATPase